MQFDFPEQEAAVEAVIARNDGHVVALPAASGAVEILTRDQRMVVHVDGTATVDGRQQLSYQEVLEG